MTENEFLLQDRIAKIKSIDEQYDLNKNAYISFSGGKDSCVLSDIIDKALPGNSIPRVFVNTGIEFLDVLNSVKEKSQKDERIVILNANVNIKQMLEEKGYPFKSKDYSEKLATFRHIGFTDFLTKYFNRGGRFGCPIKLKYQWSDSFTLKVSDKCCKELKLKPLKKYEKENNKTSSIVGLRKTEGGRRASIKSCVVFNEKKGLKKFFPLLVCDNDFMEWYIKENNIVLPKIYKYLGRTGCKGCPYSYDLNTQLEILREHYPNELKQCEWIWKPVYAEYRKIGYRIKEETPLLIEQ